MKSKIKCILALSFSAVTAVTLIVSSVAFAWMDWNKNVTPAQGITLSSGASVIHIDTYAYAGKSLDSSSSSSAYYLQETGDNNNVTVASEADSSGAFLVTLNSSIFDNFNISLSDFYLDENNIDLSKMPKLFLEFRYFKQYFEGFVKGDISFVSTSTSGDQYVSLNDENLFTYRYLTVTNDGTMSNGYSNGFSSLEAESTNQFFTSTSTTDDTLGFFSSSDYADAPTGTFDDSKTISDQCYVPGFATTDVEGNLLFSKSTIIEISINPLLLINYYWNNTGSINNKFSFGVSFKVNFSFSNNPYYES